MAELNSTEQADMEKLHTGTGDMLKMIKMALSDLSGGNTVGGISGGFLEIPPTVSLLKK